jgi:hypothetical protein
MLSALVYSNLERAHTYTIQRSVAESVHCVYVKYSSAVDSINFCTVPPLHLVKLKKTKNFPLSDRITGFLDFSHPPVF